MVYELLIVIDGIEIVLGAQTQHKDLLLLCFMHSSFIKLNFNLYFLLISYTGPQNLAALLWCTCSL